MQSLKGLYRSFNSSDVAEKLDVADFRSSTYGASLAKTMYVLRFTFDRDKVITDLIECLQVKTYCWNKGPS
jgi:hypothetical protein